MTKRVKRFLTKYCPVILPYAWRFAQVMRLGPYILPQKAASLDSPAFVEKVSKIAETRNLNKLPVRKEDFHLMLHTHGLTSGGAERQWCYLAVELASRGYAVTLLTETLDGDAGHYLPLLRGSNARILAMDALPVTEKLAKRIPAQGIPLQIYRCMMAFSLLRPSHILCQLDGGNIFGGAAALLLPDGPDALLSFRNVNPSHFPHYYQPWMLSLYKALARSHKIILSGNSQFGNDDYADWLCVPRERVATIHNALHVREIDSDCRESTRERLGFSADAPVILSVFRLSPEKNPWLWLTVIRRLRERFPKLAVLHAGVGDLAGGIAEEAKRQRLDGTIRFLGRRQDIPSLMRSADIFLLTSDFEGLPNVLLEAQAMALPIVATKVGGVQEAVIENETALLAPKGDEQTLTRLCSALLENAELRERMGRAGKEFVSTSFSHKAFGDRTLDVLGLPHLLQDASKAGSVDLPERGISIDSAYHMSLIAAHLAASSEAVVVFVEEQWERHLPLPPNSLRIVPVESLPGEDGQTPAFVFDWANTPSWEPLRHVLSDQKTAFFSSVAALDMGIRLNLRDLGVERIVFCDCGLLYRIPVLHPPLYKRVPLMLRNILTPW